MTGGRDADLERRGRKASPFRALLVRQPVGGRSVGLFYTLINLVGLATHKPLKPFRNLCWHGCCFEVQQSGYVGSSLVA
jgi:hypothetical protein